MDTNYWIAFQMAKARAIGAPGALSSREIADLFLPVHLSPQVHDLQSLLRVLHENRGAVCTPDSPAPGVTKHGNAWISVQDCKTHLREFAKRNSLESRFDELEERGLPIQSLLEWTLNPDAFARALSLSSDGDEEVIRGADPLETIVGSAAVMVPFDRLIDGWAWEDGDE